MYDIITDIWKNPGQAFSAMPVWNINADDTIEMLTKQLDVYHKRGIDAVLLHPTADLTDAFLETLAALLEEAKKRFMLVAITDCGADSRAIAENRFCRAHKLYARPMGEYVSENDEIQFCLYLKFDGENLTDVRLEETDGYRGYNIIMTESGNGADLLSPETVGILVENTFAKYAGTLADSLGQTLFGFYLVEHVEQDEFAWSWGMIEDFLAEGGEVEHLAALFFPTKEKKLHREAVYLYQQARRKRIRATYYSVLAHWCEEHGVALMGNRTEAADCNGCADFAISATRQMEEKHLKMAADMARHKGAARSAAELFVKGNDATRPFLPDEKMDAVNRAIADGANMIVTHGLFDGNAGLSREDDRSFAGYIKRMSWLGAMGTNNPSAAVLCSPDYLPINPVKALDEKGYSYNYLSLDDFMNRAHIHDGTVRIDRYTYQTVLVDGRLRLDTEIVKKLGQFAVEGGQLFRGSDFITFLEKHARQESYFAADETGDVRFLSYTKSGCPFFVLINEGEKTVRGSLVTKKAAKAAEFDPFTGKTKELSGMIVDDGFAYPLILAAHETRVIGMNPDELPLLGEEEKTVLCEIHSLGKERMTFDFKPVVGRHAKLIVESLNGVADVLVNGKQAAHFLFRPFEADITDYLHGGVNIVEFVGKDADFRNATVRVTDKVGNDVLGKGENDERWDLYDANRQLIGQTHRRGDPMPNGEYHLVVHIWIRNKEGEYLLTKRSPDKAWPLVWECTGGSALAGEDSLSAALREVKEETGLTLHPENGEVVLHADGNDYFGDIWLFHEDFDLAQIRLQKGETVDARLADRETIRSLIQAGEFVPYDYLESFLEID